MNVSFNTNFEKLEKYQTLESWKVKGGHNLGTKIKVKVNIMCNNFVCTYLGASLFPLCKTKMGKGDLKTGIHSDT